LFDDAIGAETISVLVQVRVCHQFTKDGMPQVNHRKVMNLFPKSTVWAAGAAGLVIIASVVVIGRPWHSGSRKPASARAMTTVLEGRVAAIAPRIYLLGALKPSVAYAVETSGGLVLVDSGIDRDAALIKSQLAELGLDWKRVRAVLLTHVHGDHTGGAQYLRAATGAKVYAGRGDAGFLRAGTSRDAFFSKYYMAREQPHATTVDVELDGDEVLRFGEVRFRAIATPGHTPGSICYLLEGGGPRALFTGDVVQSLVGDSANPGATPNSRPLGIYSAYLPPRYLGDAKAYLASLHKLRALPAPELVLPGHPSNDPTPQSPTMSPRRWVAMMDDGIRELELLLSRYEADGADFLEGRPMQLSPDLFYLGNIRGAAVYGFFVGSKFFLVDAPGGPGLVNFVDTALETLGKQPTAPTAVLLTSCGDEATAGLRHLVERTHVQVVVPRGGLWRVRDLCPEGTVFVSAEDLSNQGWFRVTVARLRGRGLAPVAYSLPWGSKTVLFSGRIPVKLSHAATAELAADLLKSSATDYLSSLEELRRLQPNIWLPAVPVDGQNANLYDADWDQVLAENRGLVENRGQRIPNAAR
jgi:glyoxylase-like metal-dependent hydrolase (beta-lactamase superfamily II)